MGQLSGDSNNEAVPPTRDEVPAIVAVTAMSVFQQ
jgi:hypothetical protein